MIDREIVKQEPMWAPVFVFASITINQTLD